VGKKSKSKGKEKRRKNRDIKRGNLIFTFSRLNSLLIGVNNL